MTATIATARRPSSPATYAGWAAVARWSVTVMFSSARYDPPFSERSLTMRAVTDDTSRPRRLLTIFLVSLAGLLLEVGYTRIVSFKLWYYYTYLVIGLALLGIGSGSVFVAVFSPVRRWATERIIAVCSIWGAVSIALGYLVVAKMRVNTIAIWDYGSRSSFTNLFRLGVICLAIFATFIAFGIIVAVLLGRAGGGIGRMYFSDLVGAGLGCLLAI